MLALSRFVQTVDLYTDWKKGVETSPVQPNILSAKSVPAASSKMGEITSYGFPMLLDSS